MNRTKKHDCTPKAPPAGWLGQRPKKYTLLLVAALALGGCSGGANETDSDPTQRAWRSAGRGSLSGNQGGGGGGGSDRVVVTFAHPAQTNGGPSPDPWRESQPTEGPSPDPWNPHPHQADPPNQPGTPNSGGGGDDD